MNLTLNQKLISIFSVILVVNFIAVFVINKMTLEEEATKAILEKSRAVTIEAENARNYVGDLWGKYNTFDGAKLQRDLEKMMEGKEFKNAEERIAFAKKTDFYWTIPVVAGWTVGQTNAEEANYEFRVTKVNPRNPKNEPNAMERDMLNKMRTENLKELYRVDESINVIRYMRPIKLDENCMGCHGTKADDSNGDGIDPLGFKMENWKVGEMHGAFEVIADLGPAQAAVRNNIWQIAFYGGIVMLVGLLFVVFFVRGCVRSVRKVISDLFSSSSELTTASSQISTSSQSLAEGASEQAASLEETASTMEQMSAMTQKNSEHAKTAYNFAKEAQTQTDKGSETVARMVSAIL